MDSLCKVEEADCSLVEVGCNSLEEDNVEFVGYWWSVLTRRAGILAAQQPRLRDGVVDSKDSKRSNSKI